MTATEAEAFEGDELFEASIRMRQWDELAKEEKVPTVDLRVYRERCRAHLERTANGGDKSASLKTR